MKQFMFLSKLVLEHIYHKHSTEMSRKSDTIVLDVLHKNEAKHDDMLQIMKTIHDYKEHVVVQYFQEGTS